MMDGSSRDEEQLHLARDDEVPILDRGLWEKLEDLEFQEDPAELGGMVHQVKQELLGVKDMPPGSVSCFRQAMDCTAVASSHAASAQDLDLTVRKPVKLCPQGQSSTDNLAQSPLRSLTSCGAAVYAGRGEDQDFSMKFIFEKLMERLDQLERRLDKWNMDQQRRLEQVIHGKALVVGHQNGQRHSTMPRSWGSVHNRHSLAGHHHEGKPARHSIYESAEKDEDQPEREQSPLQEEESTKDGQGSPHGDDNCAEVKEWIATNSWDLQANGRRTGAHARASEIINQSRRRSSRFAMAIAPSKMSTISKDEYEESRKKNKSALARIVYHPVFDYFFAAVIMLNSLYIGVQTHYKVRTVDNPVEPFAFFVIERVFTALFSVELVLRFVVAKCEFFALRNLAWNLFDLILVSMSVVEQVVLPAFSDGSDQQGGGGNVGKVIKMFRMVRIIRIMRVLRFLAELRVMVTLIIHSVRSLFWLLVLLMIILYVFAIFFTQGVTDFLTDSNPGGLIETKLKQYYGGLNYSFETLFLSITGGVSWIEVLEPLKETGWFFVALFMLYIFFCVFSVLNIVTGVFVDGAIQRSAQERDLRLEKEKEQKKVYVSMLNDLLEEIDSEGTGKISREQLQEAFEREEVKYSFSVLDIDIADSNYLFDMLDQDRSGEVDTEEFVTGCLRLKGNAKSLDIHTLMFEVSRLMNKVEETFACRGNGFVPLAGDDLDELASQPDSYAARESGQEEVKEGNGGRR